MVKSDLNAIAAARSRYEHESGHISSFAKVLYVHDGEEYREADDEDVVLRAQELVSRRFGHGLPVLANSHSVRAYIELHMGVLPQSRFAALFLNGKRALIAFKELFIGTEDEVTIHPREVVREALACGAKNLILVRNNPSGETTFSDMDGFVWRQISSALRVVEIIALDYLLVGSRIVSGTESGWIQDQEGP